MKRYGPHVLAAILGGLLAWGATLAAETRTSASDAATIKAELAALTDDVKANTAGIAALTSSQDVLMRQEVRDSQREDDHWGVDVNPPRINP